MSTVAPTDVLASPRVVNNMKIGPLRGMCRDLDIRVSKNACAKTLRGLVNQTVRQRHRLARPPPPPSMPTTPVPRRRRKPRAVVVTVVSPEHALRRKTKEKLQEIMKAPLPPGSTDDEADTATASDDIATPDACYSDVEDRVDSDAYADMQRCSEDMIRRLSTSDDEC